jgi:hypothetical protein
MVWICPNGHRFCSLCTFPILCRGNIHVANRSDFYEEKVETTVYEDVYEGARPSLAGSSRQKPALEEERSSSTKHDLTTMMMETRERAKQVC